MRLIWKESINNCRHYTADMACGIDKGTDSTGENLDAVTAVTHSFKMAEAFAGNPTGGAVATSAQTIGISL